MFTTLVRPILEYGSIIWDPQHAVHSKNLTHKIKSVQKQFLLFCLRYLGNGWDTNIRLPSYEKRLALIKLPSLKSRRKILNAVFLLKLIIGVINSQLLLEKLYIRVPVRPTRYYNFINTKYYTTNYANFDQFRSICNDFQSVKKAIILDLNSIN